MTILTKGQRDLLDRTVRLARVAAEAAAAAEVDRLAVGSAKQRPAYLSVEDNHLRLKLRAKARQLGVDTVRENPDLSLLVREVAYEQWHRLLFARFLELNDLLLHPDYPEAPLSLADCEELADEEGEPDGWALAARYASVLLPGVFRLDDPAVQVRFAPEYRLRLEELLMNLSMEVFVAEDSLGWVYQFWQTAEKTRVNDAGTKIGGADLSPVTQLFTENYMVRFLLENSLGAWWAAQHPDSPLMKEWEYLRNLEGGTPATGTFHNWPASAAEVTVMDPCCGSGHFLVAMFGMLWQMRAEEEGLSPADAQDAVLRDNLFGLELDPRCTQIATFNVALEAWKQGGYRDLPTPQIACSGIPVRQTREEWLGGIDDPAFRDVMGRLHTQFHNAETLGSLINPRPSGILPNRDLNNGRELALPGPWEELHAEISVRLEAEDSSEANIFNSAAMDVVHAAKLLSHKYTFVATNPPWLGEGRFAGPLSEFIASQYPSSGSDLATAILKRTHPLLSSSGAYVLPQSFTSQAGMKSVREPILESDSLRMAARLGDGAFQAISGQVVQPVLIILNPGNDSSFLIDTLAASGVEGKSKALRKSALIRKTNKEMLSSKSSRISFVDPSSSVTLGDVSEYAMGIQTGDNDRFTRCFWEIPDPIKSDTWSRYMRSPESTSPTSGRSHLIKWNGGDGEFINFLEARLGENGVKSWLRGERVWKKLGVLISRVGENRASVYRGEYFSDNAIVLTPKKQEDLGKLWHIVSHPGFTELIDEIDSGPSVTGGTVAAVGINREIWESLDSASGSTDFLTTETTSSQQWFFRGRVPESDFPLQVAVARLVGYKWPGQIGDHLGRHRDSDGIVSLQALPGEEDAATRLRALLADAYGADWSVTKERSLVQATGVKSGNLKDWLRDKFFVQHCKTFENRPFIWHIWDGHRDGFSALLDYHRLDRATLERLVYTTLGAWIDRQAGEAARGIGGADERLAAAQALKGKLEQIIEGEAPFDVYVRWKKMHEQPIGWAPDLDDGVRLNIRPFVEADVLRSRVSVHWKKDRGKNLDGSDRINDLHPTIAERRDSRSAHEADG